MRMLHKIYRASPNMKRKRCMRNLRRRKSCSTRSKRTTKMRGQLLLINKTRLMIEQKPSLKPGVETNACKQLDQWKIIGNVLRSLSKDLQSPRLLQSSRKKKRVRRLKKQRREHRRKQSRGKRKQEEGLRDLLSVSDEFLQNINNTNRGNRSIGLIKELIRFKTK